MQHAEDMFEPVGIRIIYDGDCPICRSYVTYAGLKKRVGEVELIDAREHPDLVAAYLLDGYDLDEGMIAELDDRLYYGGEAVWAINSLISRNPVLRLLGSRRLLKLTYPAMRFVRNLSLRLRGRQPIRG